MTDYRALYLLLFNRVTDAVAALAARQPEKARDILIAAQQEAEEQYMQMEQ